MKTLLPLPPNEGLGVWSRVGGGVSLSPIMDSEVEGKGEDNSSSTKKPPRLPSASSMTSLPPLPTLYRSSRDDLPGVLAPSKSPTSELNNDGDVKPGPRSPSVTDPDTIVSIKPLPRQ
jgi:hypothetical protein